MKRALIIGAPGPTGIWLARSLVDRGVAVRVASRSLANLERTFAGLRTDCVAADATDHRQLRRALDGCDAVFDCIGLPADQMHLHPRTAAVLADAVLVEGCRCVQVSSYWSFLPVRRLPVDEDHPRQGGNAFIRLRREAEDVLRDAGAAVVHLPDFFGPEVHTSTVQRALEEAAAGQPMSWIGGQDVERDAIYVPDAMATVAELAARDEAYGSSWIIPGSGPINARRLAALASEHLGRPVKVRAAGALVLRLAALFSPQLRSFLPMVPHYVRPISFDGGRLEALLGPREPTPYEQAVPTTLDWIRDSGSES